MPPSVAEWLCEDHLAWFVIDVVAELEREVRELRRANEILKSSAAFFAAAELDRKIK